MASYRGAIDEIDGKILAVGQPSGRFMTGLSVAFDTLIDGMAERAIPHRVIDASVGVSTVGMSRMRWRRVAGVFWILLQFLFQTGGCRIVYLPIGSSRLGFVRDAIMIWYASLWQRRIVLHLHGGGYKAFFEGSGPGLNSAIRRTLKQADVIIVLGELLRDQFDFLRGEGCPEIAVVPNGVPGDPKPFSNARSPPESEVRLLYLSNMIPSKGYGLVLDACCLLKQRGRICFSCEFAGEFISAGGGADQIDPEKERAAFLQRIEQYGLTGEVRYRGVVRGFEKQELLSRADVFLLPTQYPVEGQPISILEAMSHGIPVVSTRYRAIPEMVLDRVSGVLLETLTAEEIADAIEWIVSDKEKYRLLSAAALAHVREKFTREQHLDDLISTILGNQSYRSETERADGRTRR